MDKGYVNKDNSVKGEMDDSIEENMVKDRPDALLQYGDLTPAVVIFYYQGKHPTLSTLLHYHPTLVCLVTCTMVSCMAKQRVNLETLQMCQSSPSTQWKIACCYP